MNRRSFLRASAPALALVAGCVGGGSDGQHRIAMTDELRFEPASVRIDSGETLVWANDGRIRHTVTAYGDRIPSEAGYFASGGFETEADARDDVVGGLIGADDTYSHTPTVPGEYEYVCLPHEGSGMTGSVSVG